MTSLDSQVSVATIKTPEPDETILLTYPNGNMAIREDAMRAADVFVEKFGCEIIVMPDVMSMSRITPADADRIIQHITKISKAPI